GRAVVVVRRRTGRRRRRNGRAAPVRGRTAAAARPVARGRPDTAGAHRRGHLLLAAGAPATRAERRYRPAPGNPHGHRRRPGRRHRPQPRAGRRWPRSGDDRGGAAAGRRRTRAGAPGRDRRRLRRPGHVHARRRGGARLRGRGRASRVPVRHGSRRGDGTGPAGSRDAAGPGAARRRTGAPGAGATGRDRTVRQPAAVPPRPAAGRPDRQARTVPGPGPTGVQPELVDATRERVRAEIGARVPAYTPDWTNQDRTDAGVALVRLFGSQAEPVLRRLNRLPEKLLVEHLGIAGAAPATGSGDQVVFETDRDLYATPATLGAVVVADAGRLQPVTGAASGRAQPFAAFGERPQPGNALWIGLAGDTVQPYPMLSLGFVVSTVDGVPAPAGSGGAT